MPAVGGLPEFRPPHSEEEWRTIEKELRSKASHPKPWAAEAAGMHQMYDAPCFRIRRFRNRSFRIHPTGVTCQPQVVRRE